MEIKRKITNVSFQEDPIDEILFFRFTHFNLKVSKVKDRVFMFPIYLYANLDSALDNHRIKKWNTNIDTQVEYVKEKTLYLYDIVSELLKYTIGEKRLGKPKDELGVAACLHLALIKGD
jgi:hypothetical protein